MSSTASSTTIRVLLVDHQILLRRCLASLLNRRRGIQVVGEADTGAQARALARSIEHDVVVVDTEVLDGGADLVAALTSVPSGGTVLVLSHGNSDGTAAQVLRAGARGYLTKACELDDLVQAIERVYRGELVVTPLVADVLLKNLNGELPYVQEPDGLTEREREVLGLVVQGRTNPEIARELFITEHTVKGHLAKILSKLGLENRVQLATYAVQHGLIDLMASAAE